MSDIVLTEKVGDVTWIRFNRPEVRNAIIKESADEVRAGLDACEKNGTRCIVLSGTGTAFCAGADLKASSVDPTDLDGIKSILVDHYHPMLEQLAHMPIPVVAAVNGIAAGIGSDIALACDMRLASEQAAFAEIFVKIGLMPDGGGTFTLPRLVGMGRAMEMAMTGRKVEAHQALEWGLVNHVFPADSFEQQVNKFAETLAKGAPLSIARAKMAIRQAAGEGTYADALKVEANLQMELFQTADFIEGVSAFIEKREAKFKGE